jgi:hypothetical protein
MMTDDEVLEAVRESFAGDRYGAPAGTAVRRGRAIRARRRMGGLAGAAAVAAGLTTAGLAFTGGHQPSPSASQPSPAATPSPAVRLAARTVSEGPSGTLTVQVRQLRDPAGLQQTLRADGVPATVAFLKGIPSLTPPVPQGCEAAAMSDQASAELQAQILGNPVNFQPGVVAFTVDPGNIPPGIGLNLLVQAGPSGYGWSLGLVKATPACTGG